MFKITNLLSAGVLMGLMAMPGLCHHAFSSEFDAKKPVSLSGSVSKVEWGPTHAYVYITAMPEGGKTEEWKLEMASPEFLTTQGLNQASFKVGENLVAN